MSKVKILSSINVLLKLLKLFDAFLKNCLLKLFGNTK